MRVKVISRMWDLVFRYLKGSNVGYCDSPTSINKRIVIDTRARGERLLELVLHETHHAADWWKDEEWVHTLAEQQARIVCRQEVLERFLDCDKLLERAKHILEKHGYRREEAE